MRKNLQHLIFRFTITILLLVVLISGTLNQKTSASESGPKLEFWFEIAGKQTLEFEEFEQELYEDYNHAWTGMIDLVEIQLKVKSLTGEPVRLSAIDFDIDRNEFISNVYKVDSSSFIIENPASPKRWDVPQISSDNKKVYFIWNGPGTLDDFNEYVPVEGILVGSIKLEIDSDNLPNDFFISPTIDLKGTFDDIGDLAYIDSNGVQQKYYNEDFIFKSLQVGDPDSGPDASLSSLKVEGESTTYLNLTNDIEEDPFIHDVIVSYADNKIENGIAITASPKKAGADVQMIGAKPSYTTGDIVVIEVTDGHETKTYQIKIIVTDPNDDTNVTFTTNKPSSVKSQGFNGINSYDITVDFNTLEIQVIPNVHELSTVDVTPLNFTNLQPGGTKSLTVWVTSEAGTNNAYTVNVTREPGNSDTSFEVVINSQSVTKEENTYYKTLTESVDRFTFTISDFVSTTKIYYKLGKHTGADISDYTILPANRTLSNILVQKNEKVIYTLLAVAQDGTPELSYIEVERAPSTNVDLSKVTINEVAGSTSHTQDITRINSVYSYTVKDNSSDRIIFLVSGITGEGQLIEILDENNIPVTEVATSNLNVGDNNYIIRVTAQDGTTSRDYNLVIKKLSDQKEITKIELVNNDDGTTIALGIGGANGFTYDAANNRYSFTLAYGQATNFELILTTSEKSIIFVGQSQSSNNTRVFSGSFNSPTLQNREFTNITIKAENGSVSSAFDIRITRAAADTNNKLEDIQINGVTVNGFLPNKGDYPVTIFDRDTSSVFIEGFLPENSKATLQFYVNGSLVSGSRSINLEFADNTPINVELRVTSESGVVFTYKVPVIAASNDSSIQNIQIYNASTNELVFNSFSQGTLEYNNITLPYSIETIKVVVTTTDAHATVMGVVANGTYLLNTTTPQNLTIFGKSEAGNESTQKYKFTIKRETPRSYKDLETLTVKYIDANNLEVIEELDVDASNNFTLRVDNHITPIQITATILGLQGERIVGSSTNTLTLTENFTAQQKTRTVNIIVVDEGGQQKTYTITITRANNDKVFETVKIGDRTYGIDEFDSNNKLTLDDVLFAVDRLTVLFNMIPNSNSTIVSPTSFIGNNLEGIWYFNSQTGLITATFQVKSEYGESSSTFTIEVYRETALSLKSLNGLKISAGSTVLLDETNTVADSYDIRVDRATSSVVIRTTLPIVDRSSVMSPYQPQIDEAPNKVYTYTLALNNPNASAATIHQITLRAEDGTTKTYVITIWRRNANINLNEVTIKHGENILHTGTFETAYEYLGNFEFNVSELTFIIKPADINARITINNGQRLIPVDGVITTTIPLIVGTNREINLKVESDITQDEMSTEYLSKTYRFTYDKKTASNVAELDFLEAIIGGQDLLDGMALDFANENEFGDFVVNRNFTSVTISATALNGGTVSGIGSRVLTVGRNQFIITVTSQSGTHSKDYILVIYRNNDNNYITNIEVANHALGFDPSVTDYDLGTVLYDEDKLDISVTLGDQVHAKYYINNVLSQSQVSLNYGLNTIKIQAESDYGTKGTTYTITVFRENPYKDVGLNDLIIYFDDDLNNLITYNANTFTYILELNPQDTPTTIRVMPELKNSFKQSISSTSNLDDDILINYQDGEINQTIKFIVYAEDNSQQEYTIIIKKGNVKSGDYSINDVIITNTISSNNYILFDPTQYQYSFDVAYSINQLNIDVNLNDLNAVITFVRRPVLLVIGDNLFEFFVTAENGEVGPTYKITVTRNQPSTDNELLELLIDDPLNLGAYLLGLDSNNPQVVFDGRQTYTIILNEQYINEIITILFTKKVDAQLVTGDINKQLIIDQKTKRFEINVKPEDPNGITKAYFINVEIKYEQNSLTSLKIDDKNMNITLPLISHTTLKSSVSIQTTLDNIYGNVIIKDSLGNQISGNTLNLEFGSNDYTIEVYSEIGILVEIHNLEVVREKHSDKDLNSVTLLGNDGTNYLTNFDETRLVYDIEVPINVSSVTLTANISPTAQLTGGGVYTISLDETKSITFFVNAENGDRSDTYTINVTRKQPSNDNELSEILISDPLNLGQYLLGLGGKNPLVEFDGRQTYTIILNEQYINEIITILFTKKVGAQQVTGDVNRQLMIDQKTKRFEINVKPEDPNGITRAYFINVEIKYEQNSLTSLKIDDKTMNLAPPLISHITLKNSVSIQTTLDNIYGNVIIKDSLGNQVSGNTLNLDFGTNDYTIEVYSETGVLVETHILEIIREKHSDKDIIGVTLLGSDGTNYLPNFDESQLVYDIEVPISVNTVTLTANISPTAQLTGGGTYTINLDQTKTITFFVTAENGDKSDTYTLNVTKRSLSTENEIGEIRFRDPLDNTRFILGLISKDPSYVFSPNVRDYTIELGLEYVGKQITVRYEKADPYQTITGLVNGQAIELIRGTNVFKLTVYPEDINNVDPLIYTVTINVKNKENGLESLKIDNQPIAFDSANPITYITENESAVVLVTPSNTDGKVTIRNLEGQAILSPLNLVVGDNICTIEVTNEFGQIVETYDLIIERVLSSNVEVFDATLTDNELTNYLLFDKDILHYELFVPFEMNELQLMINAHLKSLIYIDGIHIVDGKVSYILTSGEIKTISFYVVAENGDIGSTYTLEVTKLQNTDDKLKELTILTNLDTLLSINDFDPENNYYAYQVNELHTHVTFRFLVNYGQTITGVTLDEAVLLNHGLNVFEIHVQPEDLMLDPFIITIEIEVINSNIDLSELLVDGQDIYETSKTEYRLDDVSSDTKMINIETILSDINGSVKINGIEADNRTINLVPGENTITIEITSEDLSTTKTYTILINQLLDDSDTLEVLSVLTNLNNYLLGDATNNPQIVFDPITNTYKFNVNEDVETIFVDFILGSIKQQISGPFNEYLNLEHGVNIFEFIVEPEDTNRPHRTYVIEINKINDKISVDQLLVNGKDIYEEGILDYTIDSVTNDIKIIKVIPSFDNYATYEIFDANNNLVTGHDVTLNFGINNIRVVATSESGLYTQTYTITIEQTYSDDNEIIDVRFFDASTNINRLNFDPDITTYDIEFPTTTNIARLRVETHNKALVFINGIQEVNTRKDFTLIAGNTITVKFYVVAEDGTKGIEYTINVYKRKATDPVLSDNTNLLDVTIEIPMDQVRFDFDPSIYEYTINIPYRYEEMYIKAHTENLGATVSNEGAYALIPGEAKVIRLRVTAEDGTVAQREYKFTITRDLPNTDTTLKSLVIEDLSGNVLAFDQAKFSPDNRIYNITLPESTKVNRVNVIAEKNNNTQVLYNTGIVNLHGEIEGYYNTIITITVVAEDGSVGEYIVYVLHDLDFASIAEVKDISIIGNNGISYFGLDFENNIYVYDDIIVPFNVDTTRLIVQTIGNIIYLDSNHVEIEDNRLQTFDASNKITYRFRIESTNGQNKSEVYTIHVTREKPDTNSLLEHLEINGEEIRGFNPNIYEYSYIHPLQFENYVDVYGLAQSANSIVRGNDIYTLFDGQTRTINIEVTAESGDTTTYKIHVAYVNSNALLGELTVYEMIGDNEIENSIPLKDDTLEYIIIIGRDTRYVNIKGYAKDQGGASIRGFGIREVGTEDNVVEITVTSGDGLEEITYLITLRRDTSLSDLKEITLLQINDKDIVKNDEDDPFVYRYSLSNGTNTVKLSAITNNNAKVSINGGEFSSNNMSEVIITDVTESQVIRIAVKAEDGSVQHYMVVINKDPQPSILLTILLILSIILWVITAMIFILRRIRRHNKKDRNQLIF